MAVINLKLSLSASVRYVAAVTVTLWCAGASDKFEKLLVLQTGTPTATATATSTPSATPFTLNSN